MSIDQRLLDLLVCPDCHGSLTPTNEELLCNKCPLAYEVRGGIPIMLVESARRR
jgi:uncharacterized protein YbaR (Trm112 family)